MFSICNFARVIQDMKANENKQTKTKQIKI